MTTTTQDWEHDLLTEHRIVRMRMYQGRPWFICSCGIAIDGENDATGIFMDDDDASAQAMFDASQDSDGAVSFGSHRMYASEITRQSQRSLARWVDSRGPGEMLSATVREILHAIEHGYTVKVIFEPAPPTGQPDTSVPPPICGRRRNTIDYRPCTLPASHVLTSACNSDNGGN